MPHGLGRARARIRHADPRADGRRAHDRRRRRLDRLGRCGRHAAGRAGERRRAAGPDLLRPRRHASPPSPTPTWCSAGSIPSGCWRVDHPVTLDHVRRAIEDKVGKRARPRRRCGGGRHPAHRQRPHGRRHPHGVAVARPRSARLRAVRLRRRRAACMRRRWRASSASRPCWCRRGPASPTRWAASSPTCATTIVRTVNKPLSALDDADIAGIYAEQKEQGEATIAQRRRAGARAARGPAAPTCSSRARATSCRSAIERAGHRRRRPAQGLRRRLLAPLRHRAGGDPAGAGQPAHRGDRRAGRRSRSPRSPRPSARRP